MNPNEYQELALSKEADQEAIWKRTYGAGVKGTRLSNAVRGLADDTGELNGAVKRWLEYGQKLNEMNVLEEVGDCLWRLAQVCRGIGRTLEDAMAANLRKLDVRYEGGYSDDKAAEQARDRGKEAAAIADVGTAPRSLLTVEALCLECRRPYPYSQRDAGEIYCLQCRESRLIRSQAGQLAAAELTRPIKLETPPLPPRPWPPCCVCGEPSNRAVLGQPGRRDEGKVEYYCSKTCDPTDRVI